MSKNIFEHAIQTIPDKICGTNLKKYIFVQKIPPDPPRQCWRTHFFDLNVPNDLFYYTNNQHCPGGMGGTEN